MNENEYDLIIIGAGPAGYLAGTYASRYRLKNLVVGSIPGGTLTTTHRVENFPGIKSASGREIMDNFREQTIEAGTEILNDTITNIIKKENNFELKTASGKEFISKFLIVATGTSHKHLGVPGEKEFFGRGVSYCATCDGMFFKDQNVVVVGGGNTALTEALYLANICKKVYLIHRSDNFKCDTCWIEEASRHPNIEIFIIEEVEEIIGDKLGMTGVKLRSGGELEATGIFVAVGNTPNTQVIDNLNPKKDKGGYLIVDSRQETSIKGLYAAGDITTASNKFKQAIIAAAEGALATSSVQEDILRSKTKTGVLLYDLGITAN